MQEDGLLVEDRDSKIRWNLKYRSQLPQLVGPQHTRMYPSIRLFLRFVHHDAAVLVEDPVDEHATSRSADVCFEIIPDERLGPGLVCADGKQGATRLQCIDILNQCLVEGTLRVVLLIRLAQLFEEKSRTRQQVLCDFPAPGILNAIEEFADLEGRGGDSAVPDGH